MAWQSYATNLNPEAGWAGQVYVRDLQANTTETVSLASDGTPGNSLSGYNLAISQDGRFIAFSSYATNLAPDDTNGLADVYLRDRQLGTCERISVGLGGAQPNSDSGFFGVAVNADGRFVAFNSSASNLVSGDTNGTFDTFVRDRISHTTERISLTLDGQQANGESRAADISDDGRYVVFQGFAANMIPGTASSPFGVFLRDRTLGVTELVSRTKDEAPAIGNHSVPAINGDGRYVIFGSDSPDLVAGDTNGGKDVFVRDRISGKNQRVSISSSGAQGAGDEFTYDVPSISQNGKVAVFSSLSSELVAGDTNGRLDVFAHDQDAGVTARMSAGPNGEQGEAAAVSDSVVVSANGRYVAYVSDAFNLVPGDTNQTDDVFFVDRANGVVERVSVSNSGGEGSREGVAFYSRPSRPGVSADGRFVAFWSTSGNLVPNDTNRQPDVFVRDRQTGTTERVSVSTDGSQAYASYSFPDVAISDDGRYVAFVSGASNLVQGDAGGDDIFIRDRKLSITERIQVAPDGGSPLSTLDLNSRIDMSGNGRFVAFVSELDTLVSGDTNQTLDVFVYDRNGRTTERVSVATGGQESDGVSYAPTLSQDGRYVVFASYGSTLSAGLPGDIYVHDRLLHTTQRASGATGATQLNYGFLVPAISANGRFVLFATNQSHLVSDDDNPHVDLFLHDRLELSTELLSRATDGSLSDGWVIQSAGLSADARVAAFSSSATTLASNLGLGGEDIFVRERATGVPFAPVNLSASVNNRTNIALSWQDQSWDETGFRVERNTGSGFETLVTLPAGSTSHLDSDLSPTSTYSYRVVALNALGECGSSNEASATTLEVLPEPPTSLLVTAISSTRVHLSWSDESDNESGFSVARRQGQGSFVILPSLVAGSTEFDDMGLAPATIYTYRVRAFNDGGSSDYAEGSVLTLPLPPSAPTGFTAVASSQSAVQLSWTDTSNSEQGFVLERAVGNGSFATLATIAENSNAYADASVAANTTYRYVLRAYNAGGQSTAAEATATTPPNPPAPPSNLIASIRSLTSVRLNWNDGSSDETGFRVERRTGTGEYATLATVNVGVAEYVDPAVIADTAYQYRIVAFNAGGDSTPSNEVSLQIQTGGKVQITPARLNFGTVKRGKVKLLKLTLKNEGKVAIAGEIGTLTSPFRIVDGGGTYTLEPKKSRKVGVEFAPSATGLSTRTLQVTSTSAKLVDRAVSVSGRGK